MTPVMLLIAALSVALLLALVVLVLVLVRADARLRNLELALRRQLPQKDRIGFKVRSPAPRRDTPEQIRALDQA